MQISELIINQYLLTALWTTTCNTGEHAGKYAGENTFEAENYDLGNISDAVRAQAITDIKSFLESAGSLLDGIEHTDIGHDFWLTRNGHGTGFWDRGLGDIGEQLTVLCELYDCVNLFTEEDGMVYPLSRDFDIGLGT